MSQRLHRTADAGSATLSETTRILLAEDSDRDAELVTRELRNAGLNFESRRVQNEGDFRLALDDFLPHIILSDFSMPGFGGVAALRICRDAGIEVPFVFVSGTIGEEVAVEAMKAGADDYVMKTNLVRLGPTVKRALREAGLRQDRRIAEAALRASEAHFRALFDRAAVGIVYSDMSGRFVDLNPKFCEISGYTRDEALKLAVRDVTHPDDVANSMEARGGLLSGATPAYERETRLIRKDRTEIWTQITTSVVAAAADGSKHFLSLIRDISERRRLQVETQRAEAEQGRMTQLLDNIVDNIPTSVQLKSVHDAYRIVMWNKAAEAIFGVPREEAIGRNVHDLWPKSDADRFHAADLELIAGGQMQDFPDRPAQTKNRGEIRVHMRKVALLDADGKATHLLAIADDITENRRAEQIRALEHDVARQLAEADGAAQGLQAVMRMVGESEGWTFGRYWRVDEAAGVLRFDDAWNATGADGAQVTERSREVVFAPGAGLAGQVWQSGQPLWVADVSEDPRVLRRDLLSHAGRLRGAFLFPVMAEGRVIGVVSFSSHEIRQPDDRLLAAVRVIGGQIGQFLRRKQGEDRIRRLNRVYAVLSGIDALIVRVRDRSELYREACRIAVDVGGLPLAWISSLDEGAKRLKPVAWHGTGPDYTGYIGAMRLGVDDAVPDGQGMAGRAVRERKPVISNDIANDSRITMKTDAEERGFRSLAILPLLIAGDVVGTLALYAGETEFFDEDEMRLLERLAGDIAFALDNLDKAERLEIESAERRRAETKVARLNRVYAVLSGINALIVRVNDRDELFREACKVAVEAGQFKMAWIGVADWNAMKVVPIAAAGAEPEFLALIKDRFSLREDAPMGKTMTARAIREKNAVVSNEIRSDDRVLFPRERAERGVASMAILPLLVSGEAVGVLALYADEPGFFDEAEMKLLHELAGDIAFALDHLEKASRLDYLAYYDQLTGLANRGLFQERLTQHIHAAANSERKVAVVVADVERFRMINDSLGRQAGDALLKEIARRLRGAVDQTEIARIGADHFAIVLPEMKGRSEIGRMLEDIWQRCVGQPFMLGDTEIRVAFKGGIALFPSDGNNADTLFRNAEAAWKNAKQKGERYLFHAPEMTARINEKLTLENKLRQAIEKEEFVLHYQPKVDIETRRILGVEALIRWQSPERGLVPPGLFIPMLEETGLILRVGAWALQRAVLDHQFWLKQGLAAPRIAVNVSQIQMRQRDFVDVVKAAIAEGADPTGIDLEITESLLMEDIAGNIKKLQAVCDLGLKIAIDDFGTGYSSLGYLAQLPVHALKIDRSFIMKMLSDPNTMTLVQTIISLAHSLRLSVVAEGVEQEEQAKMLRLLRCDEMQGYLISKPVPLDEITSLLRK